VTFNSDTCKAGANVLGEGFGVESDIVLRETDGFNAIQVVYTNEPILFGSLISQRRNSATNWYHLDVLGSTRDLTNSLETITIVICLIAGVIDSPLAAAPGRPPISISVMMKLLGYQQCYSSSSLFASGRVSGFQISHSS